MFSHLLLPVDGSAPSSKAARAGVALAKRLGARVTIYYAVDPVPYGFGAGGAPADDPLLLKLERRARLLLGSVARRVLAGADVPVVIYR